MPYKYGRGIHCQEYDEQHDDCARSQLVKFLLWTGNPVENLYG